MCNSVFYANPWWTFIICKITLQKPYIESVTFGYFKERHQNNQSSKKELWKYLTLTTHYGMDRALSADLPLYVPTWSPFPHMYLRHSMILIVARRVYITLYYCNALYLCFVFSHLYQYVAKIWNHYLLINIIYIFSIYLSSFFLLYFLYFFVPS